MSRLLSSTPRVAPAPTFSSKTACTQRRSVMHCGRQLSNPYFSSDLDPKRQLARFRQNATWRPGAHFRPVGYGNRPGEKISHARSQTPRDLEDELCAQLKYAEAAGTSRAVVCV